MAYPPIAARGAELAPGRPPLAEADPLPFLAEIARRKEFGAFRAWAPGEGAADRLQIPAYRPPTPKDADANAAPLLPGLRMHGAQEFAANFGAPETPYERLVLNWAPGRGKTNGVINLALRHVAEYRARPDPPADRPTVFVISFTRAIFLAELLRHPEFGFASRAEIANVERLAALAARAGTASPEARQHAAAVGALRRRITDRTRGGYFRFMGYREFAGQLLGVTRRGAAEGLTLQRLFATRGRRGATGGAAADAAAETVDADSDPEASAGDIVATIEAAVKAGLVTVDEELLGQMRGGFLAADEIHNTYNIRAQNNYGAAILYALDRLEAEGPGVAPRAVFASGTLMTGAAPEIIDLLNLVIPRAELAAQLPSVRSTELISGTHIGKTDSSGAPHAAAARRRLRRDDFFVPGGPGEARWVLRPGALERIGRLSAGRVSFLLDSDEAAYPRRLFEGGPLRGPDGAEIPYLRFTPCPMSPYHARTLAAAVGSDPASPIPAAAYALYDMVYPNPDGPPRAAAEATTAPRTTADGAPTGLYLSGDVTRRLAAAPVAWRRAAGIEVETADSSAEDSVGRTAVGGPFLALAARPESATPTSEGPPGLDAYSAKFAAAVRLARDLVGRGPGKIMIYHQRVWGTGVTQILAALEANGFASESSAAGPSTLCAVCGVPRRDHSGAAQRGVARPEAAPTGPSHTFIPARFLIVHSDLDHAEVERTLARANARSNLEGYEFRGLVGSRLLQEGKNLLAFRYQLILSLPDDIPSYIQLLGRVSRKGSHLALPPDQRDVRVWTFVTVGADGGLAPEVARFAEKMREYGPIQEVERVIRRYAVDAPLRYADMVREVSGDATLFSLPYTPALPVTSTAASATASAAIPDFEVSTFEAYSHGDREVALLETIARALFAERPVWTYPDLWTAVRTPGAVRGLAADPATFDEKNFAAALGRLASHNPRLRGGPSGTGSAAALVARAGPYYVLVSAADAAAGPGGGPVVDVESYLRAGPPPGRLRVSVAEYVRGARAGENFLARLARFVADYGDAEAQPAGGLGAAETLVTYPPGFHYDMMTRLVEARDARPSQSGAGLRPDSRAAAADARAMEVYRRFRLFVTAADLRASEEGRRLGEAALAGAARGAPVGYLTARTVRLYDRVGQRWFDAPRAPLGFGSRQAENDVVVGYAEEGVFKIRPPAHLLAAQDVPDARSLARGAACMTRPRADLESLAHTLGAATRAETRAGLTSRQLCQRLLAALLDLEAEARSAGAESMADAPRWFYVLDERMPSLAAGRN